MRPGIAADEYGVAYGLAPLEDIVEEAMRKLTATLPGAARTDSVESGNPASASEGTSTLREVNKHLGSGLHLHGWKTLNGWLREELKDILGASVPVKMGKCAIEKLDARNHFIKTAKLQRHKALCCSPA